jgi:hypothetical protein
MSVYRDKRSPYFQFDFQIDGYRFSGSTKCRNERDAQTFEDARKVEAQELVDQLNAAGSGPLQLKAACDRWWIEHGSTLSDVSIKRALDRLVEIMGPKKFLHAITDADVTLMIQKRRADTRRDCTVIDDDGKRTILTSCAARCAAPATTGTSRSSGNRSGESIASGKSAAMSGSLRPPRK